MVAGATNPLAAEAKPCGPHDGRNGLQLLLGVCVVVGVLLVAAPGLGFTSDTGGEILETVGGGATLLATVAALVCFRSAPTLASVTLLLALACQTATTLLLVAADALTDSSIGSALARGRLVSSLVVAGFLICAAFAPSAPSARANTFRSRLQMLDQSGWRVAWLGLALALAAIGAGFGIGAIWPRMAINLGRDAGHLATQPLPFALGQAAAAIMFAVAAVGFAMRTPRAATPLFTRWLAIGSALAAGASIDYLLAGVGSTTWVSLAELLSAASMVALAAGALRELASAWQKGRERAALAERKRLARELHDGVAQELAYILGQSRRLAQLLPEEPALADISAAAEHALHDSRSAIYGLQSPASPTLGAAIEARALALARRSGLELTLDVEEEIVSTAEAEHGVLSILQEAISNAARHGEATRMDISLRTRGDTIVVQISDDGRGFEPAWRQPSKSGGFGLWSMQERARALGGDLSLNSAPGAGTTIELAV